MEHEKNGVQRTFPKKSRDVTWKGKRPVLKHRRKSKYPIRKEQRSIVLIRNSGSQRGNKSDGVSVDDLLESEENGREASRTGKKRRKKKQIKERCGRKHDNAESKADAASVSLQPLLERIDVSESEESEREASKTEKKKRNKKRVKKRCGGEDRKAENSADAASVSLLPSVQRLDLPESGESGREASKTTKKSWKKKRLMKRYVEERKGESSADDVASVNLQPLIESGHDDAGESPEAGPDAIDGEENTANKHEGMFDCEHADTGPSLENNDRNERDNQFSVDESARWESEFNVGHDDIAKDRLMSSKSYCYGEKYGTMPPHESRSHEMEVFLDDNETEPMDELREQIANIPLRKVKELRDQLGIKLFNRTYFGNRGTASVNSASLERKTRVFKRDNPKRPREMPSKGAAVKFTNNSMNGRRVEKRYDPRFDSRCGAFDDYIFNRDYDFLNDLRRKEKKILRNELKEIEDKDLVMAEAVKKQIKRLENQEKSRKNMEMKKDIIREIRRSNNERLKQGKRPIYYRRAEIKARELEKKYEQLKKRNKLDKFMERREKKLSRTGARKPMVRQE